MWDNIKVPCDVEVDRPGTEPPREIGRNAEARAVVDPLGGTAETGWLLDEVDKVPLARRVKTSVTEKMSNKSNKTKPRNLSLVVK